MFCPNHLVIGKLDTLDISEEITDWDDSTDLPILPIMASISIPVRIKTTNKRVREKMRIDEPLDHITHKEYVKIEQLCVDFRKVDEKRTECKNFIFPEDEFIRKYDLPSVFDSWFQAFHFLSYKLRYDLGSKNMEWEKAADFFRQFCLEQGIF